MESKERVKVALEHREPDRVPLYITFNPQVAEKMAAYLGMPFQKADAYLSNRISYTEMLVRLGNDCVGISYCVPGDQPTRQMPDGTLQDEWGFIYRITKNPFGQYSEIIGRPLSHVENSKDLANYSFPDVDAPGRFDLAREMATKYGPTHFVVGVVECTIFEYCWNLVGLEKFLVDLREEADYVQPLMDEVMNFNIEVGKRLIDIGAEMIWTGDDFGTQQGLLISPSLWRKHFKPRMKKVFEEYKKANPDVYIAYHSCGSVAALIDDLIEIGLQVLNPIQPFAADMEPARLKSKYGDRLSFFGGIDQQHVLPKGSPEDVEQEVRTRIRELAPGGGYILAPAHDIQPDTPLDNILALFKSARKWGTYPLP